MISTFDREVISCLWSSLLISWRGKDAPCVRIDFMNFHNE